MTTKLTESFTVFEFNMHVQLCCTSTSQVVSLDCFNSSSLLEVIAVDDDQQASDNPYEQPLLVMILP